MREAELVIDYNGKLTRINSRLPGQHNALNVAALAAAFAYGLSADFERDMIVNGIASACAPAGRWELIDMGQPFDVVVDYVHTLDGIDQMVSAGRAITTQCGTALRTVFGAVGLADAEKVRGCGEAVAKRDHLVLTTGSTPRSSRILRLQQLRNARKH